MEWKNTWEKDDLERMRRWSLPGVVCWDKRNEIEYDCSVVVITLKGSSWEREWHIDHIKNDRWEDKLPNHENTNCTNTQLCKSNIETTCKTKSLLIQVVVLLIITTDLVVGKGSKGTCFTCLVTERTTL